MNDESEQMPEPGEPAVIRPRWRVSLIWLVPVVAALPVLIVSTSDQGPMLALSIAWLALAVATLWSLECDQRAAFSDPRPLSHQDPGGTPGSHAAARRTGASSCGPRGRGCGSGT